MRNDAEYYLNLASRLQQTGISYVLGYFIDAKPHYPGGDDGITGPGYFWVMRYEGERGHARVKRVTKAVPRPGDYHGVPDIFPVTDEKDLIVEVVQDAFRKMLDEHMEAEQEKFAGTPTVGMYTLTTLHSLLHTDPRPPLEWK